MNIRSAVTKSIVATLAIGSLATFTATGASAATPNPDVAATTPEQRAAAYVRPAVVSISMKMAGFVNAGSSGKFPRDTSKPLTIAGTCSGTVVNPNGYIATAGHCVDQSVSTGLGRDFLETFVATYWDRGLSDDFDTEEDAVDYAIVNWRIEGVAAGSAPLLTVAVERAVGVSGIRSGEALPARVVDFQPIDQGDVALLKVERTGLPSIEIAKNTSVDIGTPVLSIGYPGSVASVTDESLEPTFKDGKISSVRTFNGNTVFEMSAPLSRGMSGGPTVNLDGRLIGVNSYFPRSESQPFNFVSSADLLVELLHRNGVTSEIGPIDTLYRQGIDAFAKGDYKTAKARFASVLERQPSHQQAMEWKLKAETMTASGAGTGNGSGSKNIRIAVIAAAVILAAGVLLLVIRRPRTGAGAVPAGPFAPAAPAPQMPFGLDPTLTFAAPAAPAAPAWPAQPVTMPAPATNGHVVAANGAAPAWYRSATTATTVADRPAAGVRCHCGTENRIVASHCDNCGSPLR
jgi:S1-C subfamily serine protease